MRRLSPSAPGATSMIPSAVAMVGSMNPTPFLNSKDTPLPVWQVVIACSLAHSLAGWLHDQPTNGDLNRHVFSSDLQPSL